MKTLYLFFIFSLSTLFIAHSQEMYNPDKMVTTMDVECKSSGWSLALLRFYYRPNDIGYKIQLSYNTTIHEYCGQARKDILQNTYGYGQFKSEIISRNGQVGDYCNRDNGWVIGLVYSVTYDNQNSNAGRIFISNLGYDSNVEEDIITISDFIYAYNNIRGNHPFLSDCPTSTCGRASGSNPNTDSDDVYDISNDKIDKKLIKKHKDFLGIGSTPVIPSSSDNGVTRNDTSSIKIQTKKLNIRNMKTQKVNNTVNVKINSKIYERQLILCANSNKCYQETIYNNCEDLQKDVDAGIYNYPEGWKNVTCSVNSLGIILSNGVKVFDKKVKKTYRKIKY